MLAQLVRPLVRTQIQLLTQTQSSSAKLVSMISQWLGYLGIQAHVSHLKVGDGRVKISLDVGKPEQCEPQEWQQILDNIAQTHGRQDHESELTYANMPSDQQRKVARLLTCVIQAGNPETVPDQDILQQRLLKMGFDESLVLEIKAAVKVPGVFEPLLEDLEPDLAAFVLSKAIGIALMDQEISQKEDSALKAIYHVLEKKASVSG
ncbi:hypothetical protein C1752_02879 [Acaryochloris thomasi RCC1774]|uniref:Uncharacterized protein n=1 Tax=Acaryochloris thomasi RCC1774 TaxID=1764569 RepID=A0A2W1JHN2_9CYAN|nr:hypothetical protein [Acaryochloris thomasi]PZD73060.1 hypothetical protein C1752_02879 [Acaryochloris thomasi RCC1774]